MLKYEFQREVNVQEIYTHLEVFPKTHFLKPQYFMLAFNSIQIQSSGTDLLVDHLGIAHTHRHAHKKSFYYQTRDLNCLQGVATSSITISYWCFKC